MFSFSVIILEAFVVCKSIIWKNAGLVAIIFRNRLIHLLSRGVAKLLKYMDITLFCATLYSCKTKTKKIIGNVAATREHKIIMLDS